MAKTAIIIDDETHIRTFISFLAKSLSIEMQGEAGTAQQGLELYKTHKPDIVILDINLPDVPGLEVLKQIKAITPKAKVVILSSVNNKAKVEEIFRAGADHYILKNGGADQIKSALKEVLESFNKVT